MEKLQMLINLLKEYIIGSPFESISPEIFRVLSDFCQEVSAAICNDGSSIVRRLPPLSSQYQSLIKLKSAYSSVSKVVDEIVKKQNISRFANNDTSINAELKMGSAMFAEGHEDEEGVKAGSDFDDIK